MNAQQHISPLQKARYEFRPQLPPVLEADPRTVVIEAGEPTGAVADEADLRERFPTTFGQPMVRLASGGREGSEPLTVGVILSGGQAPGGHNVVAGIFDAVKRIHPGSRVIGFRGGPGGLVDDDGFEMDSDYIDTYRNTGGFDMIGSGRTKIETDEQFAAARRVAEARGLNAVVVIGGDDSNTNAALLAEYFLSEGSAVKVIGVPKTIDGDLKNQQIEVSFGFDTATRTYAELIGNIQRDAASARKYWHFIKLMGRSASHITLECALLCRPNIALISEEVSRDGQTIAGIVSGIADVVAARTERGDNFGVVLVPEGLIEFIPEMQTLIHSLNDLLAAEAEHFAELTDAAMRASRVSERLESGMAAAWRSLPTEIQAQLVMDRDPHGNVQVSRIETEKLLADMVANELAARKTAGRYSGKFSYQSHFLGYEGRAAFPTNFDANYCYSLGYCATILAARGQTGYLSSVRNLHRPTNEWTAGGVPLTMVMNMERRHGALKPVIRKALVDLDGRPFRDFAAQRDRWAVEGDYAFPGAVQYFGPDEVCNTPSVTLRLEQEEQS